mmetsp:Transcript_21436/g.45079  ORF Transcript_21436/g.45079 Transcript_21436/m.45079 type:complete len:106 (-) Transcript_21436:438-755(-)
MVILATHAQLMPVGRKVDDTHRRSNCHTCRENSIDKLRTEKNVQHSFEAFRKHDESELLHCADCTPLHLLTLCEKVAITRMYSPFDCLHMYKCAIDALVQGGYFD